MTDPRASVLLSASMAKSPISEGTTAGAPQNPGQTSRIPSLDGLRGLAILMVVVMHYTGFGAAAPQGSLGNRLNAAFQMGWSGVDLFFVLSGFLIGGILLDARSSPKYFQTFYLRRVFRILPIYYVFVLGYAFLASGFKSYLPPPLALVSPGVAFLPIFLLFLQNIFQVPKTMFGQQYLSPLWSLAVEEQFYLVAPLLIRYLSLRALIRLLLFSVIAAPVVRVILLMLGHPGGMYALTPARADALAIGVLTAILWRMPLVRAWLTRRKKYLQMAWVGLAGVLLFFAIARVGIETMAMASLGFSELAFFFCMTLLISLLPPAGIGTRILCSPILGFYGTISYCLYIIHLPVDTLSHWLLRHAGPGFNTRSEMFVSLIAFVIATCIALISWHYFERPLLRRGHRYAY